MTGSLVGVRVIDLTRVWSGPLATRMLADLGAEVIKVESLTARGPAVLPRGYPARSGFFPDNDPGDCPWNRSAAFNKLNRNKLSLTLDLKTPAGAGLFRQLAAISDVVIENFSPRVMGSLGIGYEQLKRVRSDIIMVSMPGYGLDGPMRDYVAYGSTLDAESGLAALMGYPGLGPQRLGVALPDPVAGLHAAGAVLTALWHRRQTGGGQHVDLSQLESVINFAAHAIADFQLTGRRPVTMGNRHPNMAPHGCYPCREPNTWVTLAVRNDDEWTRLAALLDDEAADARFGTLRGRRAHHDELDVIVSRWTRSRDADSAMHELQALGIPSGAVLDAAGLATNEHLLTRGFFVTLSHPDAGTHAYPGEPIHLSTTPATFKSDAPRLGEHNEYVLKHLLGVSQEDYNDLWSTGVIGDSPSAAAPPQ